MKKILLIVAGVLLILTGTTTPADAQSVCAVHQTVVEKLKKTFDEQATSAGLSSNGGMLEVYTSPTGTWTIVLTRPDGISCLMATGEHWEDMVREITDTES